MISEYIEAAMSHSEFEVLEDDGTYFGHIPGFQGVFANQHSLEACREELREVLEEWLMFRVAHHLDLPEVDGLQLPVPRAIWCRRLGNQENASDTIPSSAGV